VLAAEFNPAQPAVFVLARHLLGFRASPPAPNFYHLCWIIHPSTQSASAALGQMGWSNAYSETLRHVGLIGKRPDGSVKAVRLSNDRDFKLSFACQVRFEVSRND
jgi:hypothetical protein